MSGGNSDEDTEQHLQTALDPERDDEAVTAAISSLTDSLWPASLTGDRPAGGAADYEVDADRFEAIVRELDTAMDSDDSAVREQTADVLGSLIDGLMISSSITIDYRGEPATEPLVHILVRGLFDTVTDVRATAAASVAAVSFTQSTPVGARVTPQSPLPVVVSELRRAVLDEDDPSIRASLIEALELLATEQPGVVHATLPEIHATLRSEHDAERENAAGTCAVLADFGRYPSPSTGVSQPPLEPYENGEAPTVLAPVVPDLVSLVDDDQSAVRNRAAEALANLAFHTPAVLDPVVPRLVEALETATGDVHETLVEAVAYLGRAHPLLALPAVDALGHASENPYAVGTLARVADRYPATTSAISIEGPTDDVDELAIGPEGAIREVTAVIEDARATPGTALSWASIAELTAAVAAAREQEATVDPVVEFGEELLERSDSKTVLAGCEVLALAAVADATVGPEVCHRLAYTVQDDTRPDTAPQLALQVLREQQPTVVDAVLETTVFATPLLE